MTTPDPRLPRFADLETASPPGRRATLRAAWAALALAACDAEPAAAPLHARPRGAAEADPTYATVLDLEGVGRGVLVRTRAGHPVKVEGNPDHPGSLGATDVFLESAVLSLHDPARSREVLRQGRAARGGALPALGGGRLHVLTGPATSPTLRRLLGAIPGARWHAWSALETTGEREGTLRAFGAAYAALPEVARARCILALGGGLLEAGPAQLRRARGWAEARRAGRAEGRPPRLIVAESTPGLTGAAADRRLALPPAEIEILARAVARGLGIAAAGPDHAEAAGILEALRFAPGLVVAAPEQPGTIHALAAAMNARLGAPVAWRPMPEAPASLAALAAAMAEGKVGRLLILDANPVYDTPADLDFASLLRRVPLSVHCGLYPDETALACTWHLPMRHPLESWGDSLGPEGSAAIRQPACVPRIGGATAAEDLLAALAGEAGGEAAVRRTWPGLDDPAWRAALDAGVVAGSAPAPVTPPLRDPDFGPAPVVPSGLVAQFLPDPHLRDGRFAADAWLQELPRPITKQAWGNAAILGPADGARLGLRDGGRARLSLAGRALEVPVILLPGQAAGVVTLPLGGGRIAAGGMEPGIGCDANRLRGTDAPWVAAGLRVAPLPGDGGVVRAEWRHPAEARDPPPVRSLAPGSAFPPAEPQPSLYQSWPAAGRAWGMAIDLDACIGCNACTLACQAENNTPVVGPAEMARGREMHWLRVDLYAEEDGRGAFQPVPCMHCEKAPCEVVCPVNATVHDNEGLNLMVYARCIGTRTCSNNCPWKVRRFNWTGYARAPGGVPVRNPEVPLRPRGVIEKCTYCQHRIAAARDGTAETACQRACPTRAIHFGDLNAPDSAVARAKGEGRNYALLGELGTRPRTTYLARVRAPDDAG